MPNLSVLTVVIPVLNDAQPLARVLGALSSAPDCELIVVDGGSTDDSVAVGQASGARVLHAPAGRGQQLAAGAESACGARLWFLHADAGVNERALAVVREAPPGWGRLRIRFEPSSAAMRVIAWFMHWRSSLTGICTGDQGMWVDADVLRAAGGVPRQPLMEDIELSRRLKRLARPQVLPAWIESSSRRWQHHGVVRTVVGMWWFRLQYFLGVPAERLARRYARG